MRMTRDESAPANNFPFRHVKGLVGELDFSFHAISTSDPRIAESRMTSRAPSRVDVNEVQAVDRDKRD